jgi:flagellar biogenesis protein FliO
MKRFSLLSLVFLIMGYLLSTSQLFADVAIEQAVNEPQAIQFKEDSVLSEKTLLKVGLASIFGVLLAVVALVVTKKYILKMPSSAGLDSKIKLITVKRLTPKMILLVAQVDDKEYLIAQAGEHLNVLLHRENLPEKTDANI